MKTITMIVNEPGLKSYKKGWVSCVPYESNMRNPDQKWFKVVLTKDQYEAYPGSAYDPF